MEDIGNYGYTLFRTIPKFATILCLHSAKRVKFATILCLHSAKRVDFADAPAIMSAKEVWMAAYFAASPLALYRRIGQHENSRSTMCRTAVL